MKILIFLLLVSFMSFSNDCGGPYDSSNIEPIAQVIGSSDKGRLFFIEGTNRILYAPEVAGRDAFIIFEVESYEGVAISDDFFIIQFYFQKGSKKAAELANPNGLVTLLYRTNGEGTVYSTFSPDSYENLLSEEKRILDMLINR